MSQGVQGPLLRVRGLSKHFPVVRGLFGKVVGQVRAVDDVSFDIQPGETLGLVGESGCGKSTVGRTLLRLLEPSAGRVEFAGKDIALLPPAEMKRLRREMQVIFQDPFSSLNPRMRVIDIVGEALEVHQLARGAELRERVVGLLRKVGISENWVNRYPHEFSGGQRQRVGIARALALGPKLIVCDEAVSALDVSIRAQVLNLLIGLREELGLAYLFISHDLSVVRHLCHRVMVMYLGQVVELASTREMFEAPLHPYTRALLSAVPVADPRRRVRRIPLVGDVPTALNPPQGCRFHTRCPAVFARCKQEAPPLYELAPGREVRCFHADGLAGSADFVERISQRVAEAEQQFIEVKAHEANRAAGAAAAATPAGTGALSDALASETDIAPQSAHVAALIENAVHIGKRVRIVEAEPPVSAARRVAQVFAAMALLLVVGLLWRENERPQRARSELKQLAAEIKGYWGATGALPTALGDLGYRLRFVFPRGQALDPWGTPYQFRLLPSARPGALPQQDGDARVPHFEVRSLGADRKPSSEDLSLGM